MMPVSERPFVPTPASATVPGSPPPFSLASWSPAVRAATIILLLVAFAMAGLTRAYGLTMEEPRRPAYAPDAPAVPVDLGTLKEPLDIYGRLLAPGEIDVYSFTTGSSAPVTVSVSTPSWLSLGDYRPAAIVVPLPMIAGLPARSLPTLIARSVDVGDPGLTQRQTFFDPTSASRYYRGGKSTVASRQGRSFAVIVFDTQQQPGPYRLTLGVDRAAPLWAGLGHPLRLIRLKLGLYGGGGPDPGVLLLLVGDLVLVAAVVAIGVWWFKRRRTTAATSGDPGEAART